MVTTYLTPAEKYLEERLVSNGQAAITQYAFFRLLQVMYREERAILGLKNSEPSLKDHFRWRTNLYKAGLIRYDRDYKTRLLRVLDVSVHSAAEIICLADPLCYISHLSAMQRWGLTNRAPKILTCTRPVKETATAQLAEIMAKHPDPLPPEHVRLRFIGHPEKVRGQTLHVTESKNAGACVTLPGTKVRMATIGQTFLDMLQHPRQCGGMPHVLDIYSEQALNWTEEIISTVDSCDNSLVKSRAGYILEQRLRINDKRVESWKNLVQRGGSRKLDPCKDYAPDYSETWMISLNV